MTAERADYTLEHGAFSALRWALTRRGSRWPKRVEQPVLEDVPAGAAGRVSWVLVGHSTVLLQLGRYNLLLDPIWSERCSPVAFAGPRRVRPPAVAFERLPKIDVVLVSHNHYDHCDRPTLELLKERHDPLFVTGKGVGQHLRRWKIERVEELDWWASVELAGFMNDGGDHAERRDGETHQVDKGPDSAPGLQIQFTPSKHFSARGLHDRNQTMWGGFWITAVQGDGESTAVYFCGDTGYDAQLFKELRERNGRPDLAFLPIGAYDPRWFMASVHTDPEEAVRIHQLLGCRRSVGMHCATFQLTDEDIDEPVERLLRATQALSESQGLFTPPEFGVLKTL